MYLKPTVLPCRNPKISSLSREKKPQTADKYVNATRYLPFKKGENIVFCDAYVSQLEACRDLGDHTLNANDAKLSTKVTVKRVKGS